MAGQFTYQDFDLLIERGPPGSYRARVVRSPAGESAPVQFTLPFSAVDLELLVLRVGLARRRVRGPGRPESAPLKEFGGKLYSAVFQDELRDILRSSVRQTRARGMGMRLRLRLADVPELADLPWEFLYDSRLNRFLAQSRRTPLVRYLDLPDPPEPLTVAGPLRLLVMISSPSSDDYEPLDVEQEWNLLNNALAQPQEDRQVIIERLPANMNTLRRRLRQEEFHIFHFVGHGFYNPEWGDGALIMEGRNGRAHAVTGEELGGLLNESDATRLAVLNACEGARGGVNDPFAGVAQSLIQQGLPAVVAMQFAISDDAAIIFAHELYAAIADGYPLEAALAEARGAIRDEGNPTEWGTPVLYSRAPDGHIFDLTGHDQLRMAALHAQQEAQQEAERKDREEAERKEREEAERKEREEAERRDREEAERRDREEAERRDREEAERKDREEAERRERAAAERRERAAAERRERAAAARKVREEAERKERAAAARREREKTERRARELLETLGYMALAAIAKRLGLAVPGTRRELAALLGAQPAQLVVAAEQEIRKQAGRGEVSRAGRGVPGTTPRVLQHETRRTTREDGPWKMTATLTLGEFGAACSVAFSPDGRLLAGAGDRNDGLRLWNPATGATKRDLDSQSAVYWVAFSPDRKLLASAGGGERVELWNPATGQRLRTLTGHAKRVSSVAFSPDGKLLASGSWDKTVRLWDPVTGRKLRVLTGRTGMICSVAFSPDGGLLASGSWDERVRLWDPATGEQLRVLTGRTGMVRSVAFSPDGGLLASGSGDNTVRLWDPATGRELRSLTGHIGGVCSVAFSPDGGLLASGSKDNTVRLWDPATGEQRHVLTGHTHSVLSVAFSPDGRQLASGGEDTTVRLWRWTKTA
jgi:Tol biopolymer transport system component/flagellar biosynthesis GTPase FlhF